MPSFWSSVPNRPWNRRRSKLMPWARPISNAALTISLVAMAASGAMRGDRLGGLQRLVEQVGGGDDPGDEARALGFLGAHHPAGQAHLHRLGLADRPGQALRAAHAGRDAELDLGLAEFGGVGGDDEVGHHRHLAAAAEREAGDRGDPRLAGRGDLLPAGEEVGAVHVGEALGLHFLDVGAGGEGLFAAAGEDEAALDCVRVIYRGQRLPIRNGRSLRAAVVSANREPTMPPLKLSDAELDAVLVAARPIPVERRDAFLQDVAALLRGREVGPGTVHRAIEQAQRVHFDPPDLTAGGSRSSQPVSPRETAPAGLTF